MKKFFGISLAVLMALSAWAGFAPYKELYVVNVVPFVSSAETVQNPEPAVAVNIQNPKLIAVSAFQLLQLWNCDPDNPTTCGLCEAAYSGVMLSTDGGGSFEPRCVFQLEPKDRTNGAIVKSFYYEAADPSLGFSGDGNRLYGAYMSPTYGTNYLRLAGVTGIESASSALPTVLTPIPPDPTFSLIDQPYLTTWLKADQDVAVIGVHQKSGLGSSATCWTGIVWWWDKAVQQPPECASRRLNGHGPTEAVRLAIHETGKVYSVFHHRFDGAQQTVVLTSGTVAPGSVTTGQVESSGTVTLPAPCGTPDGTIGVRIACRIPLTDEPAWGPYDFNNQRRGDFNVAVAVDPRDANRVVVAFQQLDTGTMPSLHVLESSDGGLTPMAPLLIVPNALNPALAITASGRIGVLYQQLLQTPLGLRWQTTVQVSDSDHSTWDPITVSDTPALDPVSVGQPYLGDYVRIQAVDEDFYGVFSANNDPQYHTTATYLRATTTNEAGVRRLVDDTSPSANDVAVSIDPFFFRLTGRLTFSGRWLARASSVVLAIMPNDWIQKWLELINRKPPRFPDPHPPPKARQP